VSNLGLKSSLDQYQVPREDLPVIAERALGGKNEIYEDVVSLLEKLYSPPWNLSLDTSATGTV
jgi:hypothetical protein